jgi:hypothetical protein
MNTPQSQEAAELAPRIGSAISPLLNRERILAALADSLTQEEIDTAAQTLGNDTAPAEIVGMLAILAALRNSRTEAAGEAEDDGFTGDLERADAERYDQCFAALAEEWE